ncbi:uncharacterized protein TNCV_4240861, partial [Trichonephila clavipes]
MTTTFYRKRGAVVVRHLFSVEAILCCPVASWCTRNDDNDILPQPLGGGCSHFFRRGTTLPSGRVLCTRNDDNDIRPRTHGGGCSSTFFRLGTTLLSGRVLVQRGKMTTISYRSRSAMGFRNFFSVEAILCCPVASWCTRNDDNDILPQPLGVGCSSPFLPSWHYPAVRSLFGTRGTITTTYYRS